VEDFCVEVEEHGHVHGKKFDAQGDRHGDFVAMGVKVR
jgi:hypothetical protein